LKFPPVLDSLMYFRIITTKALLKLDAFDQISARISRYPKMGTFQYVLGLAPVYDD